MIMLYVSFAACGADYNDTVPAIVEVDTIMVSQVGLDSVSSRPWYRQLRDNGYRFDEPTINYPAFIRFCLKLYEWGDRTFNSYDEEYVEGVGKNWKLTAKSYNWMTSYTMFFKKNERLHLRSDIYNDVGAYVSFMALSLGYTAKMDNLIGRSIKKRENFNFNFTSSLFSASFNYYKTIGDTKITKFGAYPGLKSAKMNFDALRTESYSGQAYFFFNHRRYSHAAAYSFSKYQLKSSGSAILGVNFNHQSVDMDFSSLPADMKSYLPALMDIYRFRYNDYEVMGGYGYSWVPRPRRWLLNVTILPSLGYRHSYHNSTEGSRDMVSTSVRAMFSVTFNHKDMFVNLNGFNNGRLYIGRGFTFWDSMQALSVTLGCRF